MNQRQTTYFLLTPDSGAARRIRRVLAEGGARTSLVVGTWLELIEHAAHAYVLPVERDSWEDRLHAALRAMPDAFWARSLDVAPEETAMLTASKQNCFIGAAVAIAPRGASAHTNLLETSRAVACWATRLCNSPTVEYINELMLLIKR